MPTTRTTYEIRVKVSGGTSSDVTVHFRNGRTRDTKRVQTKNNEAIINLGKTADFANGFQNGDVIEINVTGLRYGGTTHTVAIGKSAPLIPITLTDVSTTETVAISIG